MPKTYRGKLKNFQECHEVHLFFLFICIFLMHFTDWPPFLPFLSPSPWLPSIHLPIHSPPLHPERDRPTTSLNKTRHKLRQHNSFSCSATARHGVWPEELFVDTLGRNNFICEQVPVGYNFWVRNKGLCPFILLALGPLLSQKCSMTKTETWWE